jgi:hypothetical protein
MNVTATAGIALIYSFECCQFSASSQAVTMLAGVSSYVDAWDWMVHTNLLASLLQSEKQAQV